MEVFGGEISIHHIFMRSREVIQGEIMRYIRTLLYDSIDLITIDDHDNTLERYGVQRILMWIR